MSIAYLFPGQGSQAKGMGAALFERYADWTAEADAVLGYSMVELCLEDPRNELGQTAFTQPALYVVNAMTWRAFMDDGGAAPAFVAGHSLGEYNALLAAGCFDFGTGLRLVQRRGAMMGEVRGGGMAAVIGLEPAAIAAVLEASDAGRRLDIANFNSFDQTVIAGPTVDIGEIAVDYLDLVRYTHLAQAPERIAAAPCHQPEHPISFLEQKVRKVASILPGDSSH
jgi:malonyl CoA-acyl carrier protein transacylase